MTSEADKSLDLMPAVKLDGWLPSQAQSLAKARLHAKLAERQGLVDVMALSTVELCQLAGDRRVATWLRDPSFSTWLTDRDDFRHRSVAMQDLGLQTLQDVLVMDLEPKVCTVADKLRALDMLFKLTGAYPAKAPTRWLDPDLDGMSRDEVDRELALAAVPKGGG